MKYFITVGNCPQFKNKKIEPQGHQNYKVRYNTRYYLYVVKICITNHELSRKWQKLFILEVNSVDYNKTVIHIKYISYTLTMF